MQAILTQMTLRELFFPLGTSIKISGFLGDKYKTLPTTDPPMDLAILEMNKHYIENHFKGSSNLDTEPVG